jgi:hypothetical protein
LHGQFHDSRAAGRICCPAGAACGCQVSGNLGKLSWADGMGLIIVDEKCVLFIHSFIHPIIISFKFLICDVAEVVIVLKVNYAKFGY